jgi:hypothetical protein
MKGHKAAHHGRKHRSTGGVNEAEMDLHDKPEARTNAKKIDAEAEAMHAKHGGRAKRKHGGHVAHHHSGMVKHVGHMHGEHAKHHAGRKPRKSGGSVESNPFSSALHGTPAKGRKLEKETMGKND